MKVKCCIFRRIGGTMWRLCKTASRLFMHCHIVRSPFDSWLILVLHSEHWSTVVIKLVDKLEKVEVRGKSLLKFYFPTSSLSLSQPYPRSVSVFLHLQLY